MFDLEPDPAMVFGRKKPELPSRSTLLAAVPMKHPEAAERELPGGALELTVALPKPRLARWLARDRKAPIVRRFELDVLGVEVWRMMDGRTSVRTMIESFASAHRLNLREAEVSMLAYLRTLTSRGIMALSYPPEGSTNSARKEGTP